MRGRSVIHINDVKNVLVTDKLTGEVKGLEHELIGHVASYYLKKEVLETCYICGQYQYGYESGIILGEDSFRLGDYLYLVPDNHPTCRELFKLNPLAYEGKR